MGVRRFCNKWRCYIVDKQGKKHQKYFDTEKEAQDFYDEKYKGKVPHARYKKKSSAKDQDLPVGVHDHHYTKIGTHGDIKHYDSMKGVVVMNGKVKSIQRSYGRLRTKEQAITMCANWRLVQMKKSR